MMVVFSMFLILSPIGLLNYFSSLHISILGFQSSCNSPNFQIILCNDSEKTIMDYLVQQQNKTRILTLLTFLHTQNTSLKDCGVISVNVLRRFLSQATTSINFVNFYI